MGAEVDAETPLVVVVVSGAGEASNAVPFRCSMAVLLRCCAFRSFVVSSLGMALLFCYTYTEGL